MADTRISAAKLGDRAKAHAQGGDDLSMTQPAVEFESENFLGSAHGYSPCRHTCSSKHSGAWRRRLSMRKTLSRLLTFPFRHREHPFRKTQKSVHVQPNPPGDQSKSVSIFKRNDCSTSTEIRSKPAEPRADLDARISASAAVGEAASQ